MAAMTRFPVMGLWALFPEANRNEVLRLLSMLLERSAAGPAVEETGGERGADR
jgi:hypothetical protein